jgi:hypothetical protein
MVCGLVILDLLYSYWYSLVLKFRKRGHSVWEPHYLMVLQPHRGEHGGKRFHRIPQASGCTAELKWATSIIHPEATCMKEKQEAVHSLHIRKLILHHPCPNSKAFILIVRLVLRACTISSTSLKTRKSKSRSP